MHSGVSRANGWRPGLVALDVDGTLVDSEEQCSPAVREMVDATLTAGAHIVVSTGRSVPGTVPVLDLLGLSDDSGPGRRQAGSRWAICSNGAVIVTYPPTEVGQTVTFDGRSVVDLVLRHLPDALVAVEMVGKGYRVNREFPGGELGGEIRVEPLEEMLARPVTRVIIRQPDSSAEDFVRLAEQAGLHGVSYFVGYTGWLDLAPDGVSKASALSTVAEKLGVEREDILAIGDGRNDIEMLLWAGRGVAMGDAVVEVADAADDVTETLERDGVAVELRRWFG